MPISGLESLGSQILLVTTFRGEVYLLDLKTGTRIGKLWQPFGGAISSHLLDQPNNLLFLVSRRENEVLAYNLKKRRRLWKISITDVIGKMVEKGENLYLCQSNGQILSLNKLTGKEVTRYELKGGISHGLIKWSDHLLVFSNEDQLVTLSFELKKQWRKTIPNCVAPQIVIDSVRIFISNCGNDILFLDQSDRQLSSLKKTLGPIYSTPKLINETMVLALANGEILALNKETGATKWHYTDGPGLVNQPIETNGSICIITYARGWIVSLDCNTGDELWRYKFDHTLRKVTLTAEGLIIIDSKKNLLLIR